MIASWKQKELILINIACNGRSGFVHKNRESNQMVKMMRKVALIMAGGKGERFWPKSRIDKPKQFLDILGIGRTMLQITVDRINPIINMLACSHVIVFLIIKILQFF